jgi:membrane-bound lytic murein transglycosylase B
MRDAVRRLLTVRPATRIVEVRVPAIIAGRRGLPVLLSAFAVVAAASTAATTTTSAAQVIAAPAGTTMLPQVVPPTYSYPGSSEAGAGTPGAATPPGGTGLNAGRSGSPATSQLAANGIPARAVQAYRAAAVAAGCGIQWTLIAAIGRVESDHGRFGGATLLADGRSDPPIVGIPLDGRPGVAMIKDTDGGKWDADTAYDRAVGPMQFIPGSWAIFGVDGDSDGKTDPFDIDDAAASAAKYLCKAGGDLSNEAGQRNAVYSYNRSIAYVDNVLALAALYAGNAPVDNSAAPDGTPGPISPPTLPQGTIGDPPAAPGTAHPTPPPTTPKPKPTTPARTTHPSSPAPTTSKPSTPAPTTTRPSTPAPTSSSPSATPSPTCTPSPSPSPSGTNTPNGTASAAATPTASPTATGTASANATGTPTPSPSPTLPPCPS